IRTPDLLVRSQTLYPTELRARSFILNALQSDCSENWGTTGNISESKLNPSPTFPATSLRKLTSGKLTSALTFEYSSVGFRSMPVRLLNVTLDASAGALPECCGRPSL